MIASVVQKFYQRGKDRSLSSANSRYLGGNERRQRAGLVVEPCLHADNPALDLGNIRLQLGKAGIHSLPQFMDGLQKVNRRRLGHGYLLGAPTIISGLTTRVARRSGASGALLAGRLNREAGVEVADAGGHLPHFATNLALQFGNFGFQGSDTVVKPVNLGGGLPDCSDNFVFIGSFHGALPVHAPIISGWSGNR